MSARADKAPRLTVRVLHASAPFAAIAVLVIAWALIKIVFDLQDFVLPSPWRVRCVAHEARPLTQVATRHSQSWCATEAVAALESKNLCASIRASPCRDPHDRARPSNAATWSYRNQTDRPMR